MSKPGPKPFKRLEIDAGPYKPRMPSRLHPDGKRLWRVVVPILADAGVLKAIDRAGLEALCTAYGVMAQAAEQLAADGGTHRDERGIMRKHPAFQVWRDSQATFRSWAGEFGLTPLARKSIPAADVGSNPTLAEILFDLKQ